MIKRRITSLLGALLLSSTAYAGETTTNERLIVDNDLKIKLGAYANFEVGTSEQSRRKNADFKPSSNRSDFAFNSDAALKATISHEQDGLEYGSKIVLVTTAKRKSNVSYNGTHIFAKGEYGHVELGSPIPVAYNMMVSSSGLPGKYINLKTAHMKQDGTMGPSFLTSDGCFIGDELGSDTDKAVYSSEPPRTINYYTPKFAMGEATKVKLGISYTPDTANTGAAGSSSKSDGIKTVKVGHDGVEKFELDRSLKNAFGAGIELEHELSEDSSVKVALTGEYGKSVGKATKHYKIEETNDEGEITEVKKKSKYKLADLRSYNVGAEIKAGNFKYSACYGSHGKSLTTPELHRSGRNAYYYSAGLQHKYNKLTTDLVYFSSEKYKNKVNSIQLKGTYTLAKGFKPYVSITHFTAKGKAEYHKNLKARKTSGMVFVAGTKLSL
jgi:hypothetical protein